MKKRILYLFLIAGATNLVVATLYWWRNHEVVPQSIKPIFEPMLPNEDDSLALRTPAIKLPKSTQGVQLKWRPFSQLMGWKEVRLKPSFDAFQLSCRTFLHDSPDHRVGSPLLPLKAKDWYPACQAASRVKANSETAIRHFFETWFTPVEFSRRQPVKGLFTGYYVPLLQASVKRSADYSVPIYATPSSMITANLASFSKSLPHQHIRGYISKKNMLPFYSRAEINRGAINGSARVLAWVKSEIDRLILETEGSGVVEFEKGQRMALGYASDNGGKYRAIASLVIAKGYMKKDEASMKHIRSYFEKHPAQLKPLIEQNQSFVFFRKLPDDKVYGSQGIPLSPGYSMAVDRRWIPMGVPLWLSTSIPNKNATTSMPFNRLLIAQDTGGSIRGLVRGDIYWGPGEEAARVANHIESQGSYSVLIPNKKPTEFVQQSRLIKIASKETKKDA